MKGVVVLGGYGKKSSQTALATPRASTRFNVYGLSVDVFVFGDERVKRPCAHQAL